jgi:hypothetical protein
MLRMQPPVERGRDLFAHRARLPMTARGAIQWHQGCHSFGPVKTKLRAERSMLEAQRLDAARKH